MFPDMETAVIDLLERDFTQLNPAVAGRTRVDTETPASFAGALPFVRVALVTGADNGVTDYSVVDVDVFADSRATAYALAEDIRSRFTGGPHRVGTVVIDRVVTEEKPRRLPWEDENIRRFGATYRFSARR